jgi:hypothetical protein
MRGKGLASILLLLLLLAPEPLQLVAPWLEQPVAEASASSQAGGCPTCKVDLAALQGSETYGFHVLFKQCYGTVRYAGAPYPSGMPHAFYSFSGSSAYISGDGRYVYIGAGDGVHIVDLATGKEVAKADMPGATFCTNGPVGAYLYNLNPDQVAEGPNGTVVEAPHFGNPYVVYPDGSKREIPVYDKSELSNLYSYQLKSEGTDYFWGNSKGIAAFSYNGQVYWKKDYSSEGGIHQVSAKSTVAALSKEGTLHLIDKKTGNEIKAVKGVRAVAEGGSHYVALDGGNQTPIAHLYDDGTMTDPFYTIDDVIAKMASGVSRNITALFALSPSTLYILFIVNETKVIDTAQFPVKARYIKVKKEGETLLATATGEETLVLRVDGTTVTVLAYKKNEQPANAGDVAFAKTTSVKDMDGKNVTVAQPGNGSVLLAEVFEAGACAQISLLNPRSLKPGPHVEVRGTATAQVKLEAGNPTPIAFGPHFTPLRVTVELGTVTRKKVATSILQRDSSGFPVVTPMYADTGSSNVQVLFFNVPVGRTESFWNVSLRPTGGLFASYRFRAVVYAMPAASRSIPVASIAVFWYKVTPTRIDAFDQISVTASISSTGVAPQNAQSIELAKFAEYTAAILFSIGTLKGASKSFTSFVSELLARREAQSIIEVARVAEQPATDAAKRGSQLFQQILGRVKQAMENYGDAGEVSVPTRTTVSGVDKALEEAARSGVTPEQLSSALKAATEETFKSRLDAVIQSISPREAAEAFQRGWLTTLDEWSAQAAQQGYVEAKIGDQVVRLTADQLGRLRDAFVEALVDKAKEAGSVADRLGLAASRLTGNSVREAIEVLYDTMYKACLKEGLTQTEAHRRALEFTGEAVKGAFAETLTSLAQSDAQIYDAHYDLGAWFVVVPPFMAMAALVSKKAEAAVAPTPDEVAANLKTALVEQGVSRAAAERIASAFAGYGKIIWTVEGPVEVKVSMIPNWFAVTTTYGVPIALKIAAGVTGTSTLFGATVSFAAYAAPLAMSSWFLVQGVIAWYTAMAIGAGKVGSTVVRGIAFLVSTPAGEGIYLGIDKLPDISLHALPYNEQIQSLYETLKAMLEGSKGALGAKLVKVEQVGSNFEADDWKQRLARAFGSDVTVEAVGPAVIPVFWAQPSFTSDTATEWTGTVDVKAFDVAGVREKTVVETGANATMPVEAWKQLKVTAYGPGGQALGDFVPYEVQAGGRRAVYLAPACLYDVVRIGIEPGTAWGGASVEATVTVEGAIIADAVLSLPSQGAWRADAEWSGGADFKTAAVGIFGFNQIYVVGVQRAYGKGETYLDYGEILRYWDDSTKTFFMPGDALTGDVGTSWAATFWIYTQPFNLTERDRGDGRPTTPVNPNPGPQERPGDRSEDVQPSPTMPTIPPIYTVKPGEVWIGLYVNGTFPFGTLPTLLTVYLFTADKATVYFSVNYTISVEEGAVWRTAESGPIMNGTVSMRGNYTKAYTARIAHLIDKAALLANATRMPVIVGFYGWARRLDTNKTSSAYLAVPVLPGHVPVKPAASVTFYVYDAVARMGIPGANVTMVGPAYLTGLTNSTGYLTFANVRNGTYKVTVSATGYQTFSTVVTVARDMLLNTPLLPVNAANVSALLVKVRTSDGVPVQGAAVYVNGTLVGYTDSYGELGASYPWGARLNVTVSYMGWWRSQLVEMVYPRVLVVFEYPGRSEIFKPQVTAVFVQAVGDRAAKHRNMSLLCAVMVNSNNTYTAEVGFKKGGRVVSKTTVTRSPSRSMLDIFTVSVNVTETGALVPYLNVTWARADSDPRDNYVEGEPIRSVTRVFVALGITYEVERWGLNVPGLIYPGSTVFRINVSIWVVGPPDLAGKVKMAKPMKLRAFLNHRLVSAYSQPLGNATVWELGNGTVLSALVTCPYARYMSPILLVDDLGSATEDYELVVNAPGSPKEVELPPHVIVQKTAEPLTPAVRYGDKVRVRVRVWTNLVKPGEGLNAKLYFHYGKLDNESYKFSAWSDVFNLQPGDQVVETQVPTPKEFKMQWYEAVKTDEGNFFLGATEDSWGGDNWAKATITYVNTGSVFTWILIGIGVIILLLVLVAFLRGGHSWRSAMTAAEASEWLEDGGEEGGGGWLEILKGFKPPFKL